MNKKIIISTLGIIVAIMGALVLVALYFAPPGFIRGIRAPASTTQELYKGLVANNAAFQKGMELLTTREYAKAAEKLKEARSITSSPAERSLINFRLAIALANSNDFEGAIAALKEIAADTKNNSRYTCATAVQEMGEMFYEFGDPRITAAIFAEPPYSVFYDAATVNHSYSRLFDYASSLYPLPLSDFRVANWYAARLLKLSADPAIDPAVADQYKTIIRSKMERGDNGIIRLDRANGYAVTYAKALVVRASLKAKMARLKEVTLGDPKADFERALAEYSANGLKRDGSTRLRYAAYLLRIEGRRTQDIVDVLKPALDPEHQDPAFLSLLAHERNDQFGMKDELIELSGILPGFKGLLMSLGWNESDFTPTT